MCDMLTAYGYVAHISKTVNHIVIMTAKEVSICHSTNIYASEYSYMSIVHCYFIVRIQHANSASWPSTNTYNMHRIFNMHSPWSSSIMYHQMLNKAIFYRLKHNFFDFYNYFSLAYFSVGVKGQVQDQFPNHVKWDRLFGNIATSCNSLPKWDMK